KPIIFVLNNGLYGIDEVVGEKGHIYDELARWNYQAIPEAMGCKHWFTVCVSTVKQLEQTISTIQSTQRASYVEVLLPPDENQPLSDTIIQQLYKAKVPNP
ncbi:MAG: alpha-keto acid decarboxylase family protein, partial [Gammaproteobacteria bacterium]